MVEREAGSKVSCTSNASNVRHGTTSYDLISFSTCVCLLLVDDESMSIEFVHIESNRNSLFSLESRSST